MNKHVEVEAKFSVSQSTTIPDLTEIHGVTGINGSEVHHLSAVYFDTDDLRLTRARITLRRRTGGNDAGWHIKFPGAFGRTEIHGALDAPGAGEDTPPTTVLGHVRALLRGRSLQPIAQVDNERHVSYLSNDLGDTVGEFCDDHVSTVSHLPGGVRQQWREWEFELSEHISTQEAGWDLLQSATTQLTSEGAFVSASPSKLVSALGDSINYAPVPPKKARLPKGDPARAVLAAIEANADKIIEYDPKVRADEWDSVHQMRVATRELRSHMQTFEGILGGDAYLQIEKELKLLATVLGRARDAEVIEERLTNLLATEVGHVIDEETKQELLNDLGGDYVREHVRVVAALDSDRYSLLLQSLEDLLVNPPLMDQHPFENNEELQQSPESEVVEQIDHREETDTLVSEVSAELVDTPDAVEASAQNVTEVISEEGHEADQEDDSVDSETAEIHGDDTGAPVKDKAKDKVDAVEVLLKHLDKTHAKAVKLHKKAIREWDDQEIPVHEREENFHNVRKSIKKLRYSAEAVGEATPVKTKKLYKACSRLQSVLGDFQDAVTSRDELLRRAQLAHRKGKDNFAYGVLYQLEQTLSRTYLEGYSDAYHAVAAAYDKLEAAGATSSSFKKKDKKSNKKKKK